MGFWGYTARFRKQLKLHIVARGRMGRCPEADLIARYEKRIGWPFQITEMADAGGKSPAVSQGTKTIALDETGELLDSTSLAHVLEKWRDSGTREVRFLIGAADGLSVEERANADLLVAFGRATWPHMLIRAMLVEQIYRATSIIAGHPYHREG